ncbi:MAG: L-aspartate oxidase [Phycisphaerae bacterium]
MSAHFSQRRFLINFDVPRLGQVFTDVLVIGTGVAGLRAAIEAARFGAVLLVCKDGLEDSNTRYAQGGIAAVLRSDDSPAAHVRDTLAVGCELGDAGAVQRMVADGPARIRELRDWGAAFDLEGSQVALGLEGGHSTARIVHAHGDATGAEVIRVLAQRARAAESVRIFERCFVTDLLVDEDRCVGALTFHAKYGYQAFWAKRTLLASGGAGQLYRETTNSPGATGDGPALAFRAGAELRDMEFIQFHPTTLYVAGASRALISEAVRGEGAHLVDRAGNRFMPEFHVDAELAPRDVVSRAMSAHITRTNATCVYLDVRHLAPGRFAQRFPTINKLCLSFDIDPARELIPVRPAAHYTIGGASVDAAGRTTLDGLLACGEAAASGVHGANRLASNSLLEGLVFGRAVGETAGSGAAAEHELRRPTKLRHTLGPSPRTELDVADIRNSLRALMWRNAGIERTAPRLEETLEIIDFWGRYVMDKVFDDRVGWETQNLLTAARLVAQAALVRKESRGTHFRADYPTSDPDRFLGHVTLRRQEGAIAARLEPLRRS